MHNACFLFYAATRWLPFCQHFEFTHKFKKFPILPVLIIETSNSIQKHLRVYIFRKKVLDKDLSEPKVY